MIMSTQDVIQANLAKTDNQVRDRCRSKSLSWQDWQMVQKRGLTTIPMGSKVQNADLKQ